MLDKTPKQIADEHAAVIARGDDMIHATPGALSEFLRCAIEADRAQRQPEIHIVQNDAGDVVDAFRIREEATAAYGDGYTVVEETVWERGEYALVTALAEL